MVLWKIDRCRPFLVLDQNNENFVADSSERGKNLKWLESLLCVCMFEYLNILDERVASGRRNATMIITITGHVHIAFVAPRGAPRVLDDVVVFVFGVDAVADGQHTVIQFLGAALWLVVHALRVELEGLVRCVDGHGHRADGGQGGFQFVLVAGRDVNEALVGGAFVGRAVFAGVVDALVRVRFLGVDAVVFFDVLEGVVLYVSRKVNVLFEEFFFWII